MRKKKDRSGIFKFSAYQGVYRPKNLPKEHPANQNLYDAVGKEFMFTAVFKDEDIWQFFASEIGGNSVGLGTIHYDDIEFSDIKMSS